MNMNMSLYKYRTARAGLLKATVITHGQLQNEQVL